MVTIDKSLSLDKFKPMNRLILIGNGFDLAHGLKTTYRDFILWYFTVSCQKAFNSNPFKDKLISIQQNHQIPFDLGRINTVEEYVNFCFNKYLKEFISNQRIIETSGRGYDPRFKISFKSEFFKHLIITCHDAGWVDIEKEFYKKLVTILKTSNPQNKATYLKTLNDDMGSIVEYLNAYLCSLPPATTIPRLNEIFNVDSLIYISEKTGNKIIPDLYVLNFNYTETSKQYIQSSTSSKSNNTYQINYIHGKAGNPANPLVFGFGDELDENYTLMENEEIRGFLEYIKSFWYFRTNSYHDLLRFIEYDNFELYVLGHSCGLSDRTMLNMIFEHPNCRSIKIYYHEFDDGTNNFKTLTQDISRHFKDKVIMRKKIVPLPKSQRMPQWNK